jgi:hypothetical protein
MKRFCTMTLLLALSACGHLGTLAPPGVDLSGTWVLDARRAIRRRRWDTADRRRMRTRPFGVVWRRRPVAAAVRRTDAAAADGDGNGNDDRTRPAVDGYRCPNQPYRDIKWGEQDADCSRSTRVGTRID